MNLKNHDALIGELAEKIYRLECEKRQFDTFLYAEYDAETNTARMIEIVEDLIYPEYYFLTTVGQANETVYDFFDSQDFAKLLGISVGELISRVAYALEYEEGEKPAEWEVAEFMKVNYSEIVEKEYAEIAWMNSASKYYETAEDLVDELESNIYA